MSFKLPKPKEDPQYYLDIIKRGRHLARTDLFWLATEILGFDLIDRDVHGPVIDILVPFKNIQGTDNVESYPNCHYTPRHPDPAEALPADIANRRLILDPRGWFKTTINVITHTVQCILNFPNISMLIVHASTDKAQSLGIAPVKEHFSINKKMRWLFPEFCAPRKKDGAIVELGTQSQFNIPARTGGINAPTLSASSITSSSAGMHYHWIKFTDVVDEQNSLIDTQRRKVKDIFYMYDNLLISPKYFIDVEGTCYHFDDLYNDSIIDREMRLPEEEREYKLFVRGCYKKKAPMGKEEQFIPEERDWPYLLDAQGERISRFPKHSSLASLKRKQANNEFMFATQQLNHPVAADEANRPFPMKLMRWISREALEHVPLLYFSMTLDTAEKITTRSDFTAMTVVGWDRMSRKYVVDGLQDKFLIDDLVKALVFMYTKWKCRVCKIEESSFNRGIEPYLRSELRRMGININFEWLKRDNTPDAKAMRILALQPFYRDGTLIFSEDLNPYVKEQFKQQLTRHPSGHDDLIDSLADHLQNNQFVGAQQERASVQEIMKKAQRLRMFRELEFDRVFPQHGAGSDTMSLGVL